MEKLGYIVSKTHIRGLKGFVGLVDDVSKADPSKPMLLVGLDVAKAYAENFSMVEKKIADNVFWTYGKTEKRAEYEKDIEKFYKVIIDNILNKSGRYYTVKFAYKEYFQYVNPMCNITAKLMGIAGKKITIGEYTSKLGSFDWSRVLNSSFKSYFSAKVRASYILPLFPCSVVKYILCPNSFARFI